MTFLLAASYYCFLVKLTSPKLRSSIGITPNYHFTTFLLKPAFQIFGGNNHDSTIISHSIVNS